MIIKKIFNGILTIFQGIGSLFLVLFVDPFSPLDSFNLSKTQNSNKNVQNIILIHGHLNSTWSFFWMKKSLQESGYKVFTPAYGSGTTSIYESANQINKYIQTKKITNPIIVGTSIGGLIGLAYLNNFDMWDKSKSIITIATPFNGTNAAKLLKLISKSANEILPDSKLLPKIGNHKNMQIEKVISFRGKFDETVPPKSSIMEGAKNIEINCFSHFNAQYFSQEVIDFISKTYRTNAK